MERQQGGTGRTECRERIESKKNLYDHLRSCFIGSGDFTKREKNNLMEESTDDGKKEGSEGRERFMRGSGIEKFSYECL